MSDLLLTEEQRTERAERNEYGKTVAVLVDTIRRRDNKIVRLARTIKRLRKVVKDWEATFDA